MALIVPRELVVSHILQRIKFIYALFFSNMAFLRQPVPLYMRCHISNPVSGPHRYRTSSDSIKVTFNQNIIVRGTSDHVYMESGDILA